MQVKIIDVPKKKKINKFKKNYNFYLRRNSYSFVC